MKKVIDMSRTIYELCTEYPEIISIMKDLGFDNITNKAMLNTAGRFMTLSKGAEMKKIDIDKIKEVFQAKGYEIMEASI